MTSDKPWYKSKGVWGSLLTVIFSAIGVYYNVSATQAEIKELAGLIVSGVTVVTGALAWYGRVVADTKIGK